MNTKTAIILILLAALIFFFAGMEVEYKHIKKDQPEPDIDTVTIIDTVFSDRPVPVAVVPDGYELIPVGLVSSLQDSLAKKPTLVTLHDTTYISIPMSTYRFTDGTTYDMAVRGYDVSLLYHKSFQETKYITKTVTVPEYRDYGLIFYPQISTLASKDFIYAGAGIGADIALGDRKILRFEPEVNYGILWTNEGLSHGVYVGARFRATLIRIK